MCSSVVSAPACFKVNVVGLEKSWLAPCGDFLMLTGVRIKGLCLIEDSNEGLSSE